MLILVEDALSIEEYVDSTIQKISAQMENDKARNQSQKPARRLKRKFQGTGK